MTRFLLLFLLAVGCTACASSTGASPPANQALASAQHLTTAQRYKAARPIALKYVKALSNGNPAGAQLYVGSSGFTQLTSLTNLQTWFSQIPVKQLKVKTKALPVKDPSAVAVKVTMSARLGPAPLTPWITLGDRILLIQAQDAGWRVVADVSSRPQLHDKVYGLALMDTPHILSSPHVSVLYSSDSAKIAAQKIQHTGQQVAKMLHAKYGGGSAAAHPLIYVVDGLKQGEAFSGVKITRKETPQGWQYKNFAYIDYPEWLTYDPIVQSSTIAHELTHVATQSLLAGTPHSLIEGVAMYEENRYINAIGYSFRLTYANSYYQAGTFPSAEVWSTQVTDWGLRNLDAVQACYEDGEAMTAAIMRYHGGVAGLRRLGVAFRSYHHDRYSETEVRDAFQRALGVSFDQVVSEAHAYAAANA